MAHPPTPERRSRAPWVQMYTRRLAFPPRWRSSSRSVDRICCGSGPAVSNSPACPRRAHPSRVPDGQHRASGELADLPQRLRHTGRPDRRLRAAGVRPHRGRDGQALRPRRDRESPAARRRGARIHHHSVPRWPVPDTSRAVGVAPVAAEKRYTGLYLVRLLIVGSPDSVMELAGELRRHAYAGYEVAGWSSPVGMNRPRASRNSGCRSTTPSTTSPSSSERPMPTWLRSRDPTASRRARCAASAGNWSAPASSSWSLPRSRTSQARASTPASSLAFRSSTWSHRATRVARRSSRGSSISRPAIVLTILLSPVLIAIAIAVKVTTRGPIFFTQERVGLGGRLFRIFKFRTMTVGAHEELMDLLAERDLGAGRCFSRSGTTPGSRGRRAASGCVARA